MARRLGCGGAILGCLGLSVAGLVVGCAGLAGLAFFAPNVLLREVTDDHPLAAASVNKAGPAGDVRNQICADLATSGRAHVSAADLSALLGRNEKDGTRMAFATDPTGDATVDVSFPTDSTDARWVNLHMKGRFAIDHAWFTQCMVDELEISSWNLGPYVAGQDQTAQCNQSLANQRAQDPNTARFLDYLDHVGIEGDGFVVATPPGAVFPVCQR